jgi:hypothetical protein
MGPSRRQGGGEFFKTINTGGNSQTATGFVFDAEYLTDAAGRPVIDSAGRLTPVFVPEETGIEQWLPVKGARIDINTTSLYVQDRWSINDHWSADVGTRFEMVRSDATGGIVGVDTQAIVPRLGVAFDPGGNGRVVFMSTYAHYAGKYGENQFAANTNVGNPDALFGVYVGPRGRDAGSRRGSIPPTMSSWKDRFRRPTSSSTRTSRRPSRRSSRCRQAVRSVPARLRRWSIPIATSPDLSKTSSPWTPVRPPYPRAV